MTRRGPAQDASRSKLAKLPVWNRAWGARLGCVLLLCALGAWAAPVEAQSAAGRLFEEGMAHAEAGRHARALQLFEEVHARTGRDAVLVNIATMQARLGQLRAAAETYRRFLDTEPEQALRERIAQALAVVESRMGRLDVEIRPPPVAPDAVRIEVDGRVVEPDARGVLRIDPGLHAVTASEDGRVVARGQVTVGEGESTTVQLHVLRPAASVPDPVEDTFDWGVAAAVITCVAAVLIGVGIGVGVYAWDAQQPIGGNGGVIDL